MIRFKSRRTRPRAEDETLSIEAACVRAARSTATIYRWIATGRLRTVKRGRRTLVRRTDLDAVLAVDGGRQ